jgi:hemerythrin
VYLSVFLVAWLLEHFLSEDDPEDKNNLKLSEGTQKYY